MKSKSFMQQGDVLIFRRNPAKVNLGEAKKQDTNILAEGEATGHAHRLIGGDFDVMKSDRMMLLIVRKEAILEHEEHGPITLGEGFYEIDRVREYDHFKEEARQVAD